MAKVILKVSQLDDGSLETEFKSEPGGGVRPEGVGILLADIARRFEWYFKKRGRGSLLLVITDFLFRELINSTSPTTEIKKPTIH